MFPTVFVCPACDLDELQYCSNNEAGYEASYLDSDDHAAHIQQHPDCFFLNTGAVSVLL